jgi:TPR repeat protein
MIKTVKSKTDSSKVEIDELLSRAQLQWESGELRSAFRVFLAVAKAGDVIAQLNLGYFYDVGVGIKPNRPAAIYWYKRAYRQGHGSAANNIGTIFRDKGDTKRALAWFERAVKLGDTDANLEIAKIYIRERNQVVKAIPYLKCVIKTKVGLNVSLASQEEAKRLLREYST